MQAKYPDYEFKVATLDDLAEYACGIKYLPTLTREIGDAWIHGGGTDPEKVSRYRKILRELPNIDLSDKDITYNLLLVPEHTWGMNVNVHFHNDKDYIYEQMSKIGEPRLNMEKSWDEQREYVRKAERLLGITPDYPICAPDLSQYTKTNAPLPSFEISWQIFDNSDYDRYIRDYIKVTEENAWWSLWDNVKMGLPDYKGGIYTAKVTESYTCGEKILYKLEFDTDIAKEYGLPYFFAELEGDMLTIKWFGKKADRRPQACWIKFNGFEECWELDKLGQWINPHEIVGSPLICGVNSGVRNKEVVIECLDSALVAPFGRRLLHYGEDLRDEDMYFNLYNNIWNTNFPMWYSDDGLFRFVVKNRRS